MSPDNISPDHQILLKGRCLSVACLENKDIAEVNWYMIRFLDVFPLPPFLWKYVLDVIKSKIKQNALYATQSGLFHN